MTTIKISKRSLSNFDDKRIYVNNIKSYPLDENMYLFKRDLLNKICELTSSVVIQQTSSVANQAGPLINNTTLDVSKESLEALINKIKELTIEEDRKFIDIAIRLYNKLIKMTRLDKLIELNKLQKLNRRNRLEDKLKQHEYYGEIEKLFDPLTKILNTKAETIQALQNKTLAELDSSINTLKSLGHHQQNSFLDERDALLTPTPDPRTTLKDDRGQTFVVDNDTNTDG